MCSTRRYFRRVVAGVCKNMPRDYADNKHDGEILRELNLPLHDIWEFDCPRVSQAGREESGSVEYGGTSNSTEREGLLGASGDGGGTGVAAHQGSSLIYMTIQEAQRRLRDGSEDAKFVYYTEMDQVRGRAHPYHPTPLAAAVNIVRHVADPLAFLWCWLVVRC